MNEPAAKLKTYAVINNGTFTTRHLELRHNNVPFLWANTNVAFFSSPVIAMQTTSPAGPVVAAAKLPQFSTAVDVFLGDPNAQGDSAAWTNVERESFGMSTYSFRGYGEGHLFQWRRTHRKELGSSRLSQSDYKLVDPTNNNKILAAYIKDSFFGGPEVGHFDFYVELGNDLELQALAAMLGIEERLRQQRRRRNA